MNIIEALKSGKRIKRKDDPTWFTYVKYFTLESVLATDWQVEEEERTIQITESEFWEAANEVYDIKTFETPSGSGWKYQGTSNFPDTRLRVLAEKIGFR